MEPLGTFIATFLEQTRVEEVTKVRNEKGQQMTDCLKILSAGRAGLISL